MADESEYEILNPIGQGGFGRVYRARVLGGPNDGRIVALKMATTDNVHVLADLERLRDEARILEMLEHPGIVKAERLVQLRGVWTIVMEFVEGIPINEVIRAETVEPGVAIDIIEQTATALHYAYDTRAKNARRLRLIHRDIKPSNLLVTAAGQVKVLDFGIASANFDEREGLDLDGNYGSADYMSPERLNAADGPGGDVYSMGLVLYELITGEAFGRTSPIRNKHAVKRDAAVTLLRMVLGEDDEYDDIVELFADMTQFNARMRPKFDEIPPRIAALKADFHKEVARRGKTLPFGTVTEWAAENVPVLLSLSRDASRLPIEPDTMVGRRLLPGEATGDEDELFGFSEPPSGDEMFALAPEGDSSIESPSAHEFGSVSQEAKEAALRDPALPVSQPSIINTADLPDPTSMETVDYWDAAANADELFGGIDDTEDDALSAVPDARLPAFDSAGDDNTDQTGNTPAIDRTDERGSVGLLLIAAGILVLTTVLVGSALLLLM